jgi:hypothetical protein
MVDGVEKKGLAVLKIFQDMHCRSNVNSELVAEWPAHKAENLTAICELIV